MDRSHIGLCFPLQSRKPTNQQQLLPRQADERRVVVKGVLKNSFFIVTYYFSFNLNKLINSWFALEGFGKVPLP